MKIRIAIESTLSEDKSSPTKFWDRALLLGARKTFCISNFINVKVIPSRDSFTGKSLLRSLRGIAPKIINIRIRHWNRYTIFSASASISMRNRVAYNLYIHNFCKIYIFPHIFNNKNINHLLSLNSKFKAYRDFVRIWFLSMNQILFVNFKARRILQKIFFSRIEHLF